MCRPDDFPPYGCGVRFSEAEDGPFVSCTKPEGHGGRHEAVSQRTYECADCGDFTATVFLPEGRYLCRPCWSRLRALRQAVLVDTSSRYNARRR